MNHIRNITRLILVLGLLGMLVVPAFAQENPIRATVPFAFIADGRTLPAGNYEFVPQASERVVLIRSLDDKNEILVPVITMLAPDNANNPRVTFDKIGGKDFLEALWPSGDDSGYLFHSTTEPHTHRAVSASR